MSITFLFERNPEYQSFVDRLIEERNDLEARLIDVGMQCEYLLKDNQRLNQRIQKMIGSRL
jgi:hypothetical protein